MHRPAKTQGIQAGRLEGVWATGLLREDLFIGAGDSGETRTSKYGS
jgi:hypothetical protein